MRGVLMAVGKIGDVDQEIRYRFATMLTFMFKGLVLFDKWLPMVDHK